MTATFSGPQAAKLVGITYRQLDYWDRIGLIGPSVAQRHGSGTRRAYSLADLYALRVLAVLRGWGFKLAGMEPLVADLRWGPWEGVLFVSGTGVAVRDWKGASPGTLGYTVHLGRLRAEMEGKAAAVAASPGYRRGDYAARRAPVSR